MKKLTRTDFIQPFVFLDEENKPIVPSEIKKYLLLIEFSESSDTPVEQERTYAVTRLKRLLRIYQIFMVKILSIGSNL